MNMDMVNQLQAKLSRYCLVLTENRLDADDLAQEAWLKAIQSQAVSAHENPLALLLRIAKNTWLDQKKKEKHQLRYIDHQIHVMERLQNEEEELEMVLFSLSKHMTPLQRGVFLMKDVFCYSISEIAAMLQTSEGAVKSALHRARRSVHRIREDLAVEKDELRIDKDYNGVLMSMAAAFRAGDVFRFIQLALHEEIEPMAVWATIQKETLQNRGSRYAEQGGSELYQIAA